MRILLFSVVTCVAFICVKSSPVLITAQHEGRSEDIAKTTVENIKTPSEVAPQELKSTALPAVSASIPKETSSEAPASSTISSEQPTLSSTEAAPKKLKETGRQSGDDDDDDDDDLDLGVDDDDDDDDDEGTAADDDDEDDDYFERFFDDLLGGE